MPFEDITAEQFERAHDVALAILAEWRGGGVEERLAQFGVSVDAVLPVLEQLIETHGFTGREVFAVTQGLVEGVCTMAKVRLESGDV